MAGNIILPNLKGPTNQDNFFGIWSLTRAMKSAGWMYKSSGDGTNKETAGNALLDKWGPGSVFQSVQLSTQTGAAAVVSSTSVTSATITGLTGMTANSVGHGLKLSGAVNAGNNGTFIILTFISAASVTIWNPGAVSEVTSLTWSERVSGTGATITSSVGDEATLTGLSGLTTTISPGHMITITNATNGANNGTFRMAAVLSATSCRIKNSSAVAESGTLTWVENSPTGDIYPQTQFSAVNAWINMQGPSTMKLPINGPSTGNFVRGENITQTSSGAQGELIGYLWDPITVQGYLVVMPRVQGTGSGPRGWTSGTTDTITGSISLATVTTFSTSIEFTREFVFWKNTNTSQGWIAYQCVDQSAESGSRFSFLAANVAGVTASVAPGGGGTGNTLPTVGTFMCIGATTSTYTNWDMNSTTPSIYGRQQVISVNMLGTSSLSQDGTFFFVQGRPDFSPSQFTGFGFIRCDNTEDGDVDPYIWYAGNPSGLYTGSRTSVLSSSNTDTWSFLNANTNATNIRGWRRRGFSTNDAFQQFGTGALATHLQTANNSVLSTNQDSQDVDSVACAFSSVRVREPIFVISSQIGQKMRKGTLRWMFATVGGNGLDTYDSKTWVQVSTNTNGNAGTGPFIVGPWDGVSVPIQS
jgi:hypothetical protein